MKFLYPIKKLNIKPWIKYWLLKKTSASKLSELIEGTSPITIEKAYEGTTLQEIAFKGQTVQEGTPTPEAPVPVQVVKGNNTIKINDTDYQVNLQDYELCKIGNYQDRIYKENDKWYIEKNIGKVEIKQNGYISVQEIIRGANKFIWRYASTLNVAGSGNRDNLLCNYFVGNTGIWGNNNKIGVYINGNKQTNFAMLCSTVGGTTSNTKAELLSMLETWLTTNNVIMYYPLAEPTTTEITDTTLLSQLEAIKNATLISGTNEITQIPAELPFILNFKYYMKG